MKTKPLGPFLGINNRLPDFALHVDRQGDYLRSADNVDIDNAGKIRRRAGTSLAQAMSNAHSLKMTSSTTGFLVRASTLYAVTLPDYAETLLKLLTSDAGMSYARMGDSWYFSNGTDKGRITAGVAYPMGLPTPGAPALAGIGGSLLKGLYRVAVAYVNDDTGEEGGISPAGSHELTDTGGIRVTLPGPSTGATHVNVYLSGANGGVPLLAATVTADTATCDLIALATGREANMRFEAPLPAGKVFVHNGRLCSFAGPMVAVGLPYRPGYYLPAEGYIPFPENVSIVAPTEAGCYIAADKTYFVPGDLGDVQGTIRDVLPYGAVPGTEFTLRDDTRVGWFGAKGFVIADTQGGVNTAMSDNVDQTPPASGVAHVTACNGFDRVASCGWAMNVKTMAVTTYSDWAFTSLSGCYGTKVDGIYRTDSAGDVDAVVNMGKHDFNTDYKKFMRAAYAGVNATAPMVLRVQAPGGIDYSYPARSSGADLENQRFDVGQGLRATWFDLELSNTSGADFTLATFSAIPAETTRRI